MLPQRPGGLARADPRHVRTRQRPASRLRLLWSAARDLVSSSKSAHVCPRCAIWCRRIANGSLRQSIGRLNNENATDRARFVSGGRRGSWLRWVALVAGLLVLVATGVVLYEPELLELFTQGEQKRLEPETQLARPDDGLRELLVLALDGVDRALLYDMLRSGELPGLATLLAAKGGKFPHAYFDETLLSVLPSSTLAAWASVFTGEPPARHGVSGNEYFVRERRVVEAPAPVSIIDAKPVLEIYTDEYANKLLSVPTVYERMREAKPELSIWVSMSQFYEGATRLLLADRSVVADAFKALLSSTADGDELELYAELDEEVADTLTDALEQHQPAHVITLYLTGSDHYAHVHEKGPDHARRVYLKKVVDPLLVRIREALERHQSLADRTVVVLSDHGHTPVVHDARHALSTDDDDDPPAVLRGADFRLRPFELKLDEDEEDYQAVLAYGGAMAYVYLADRSGCAQAGQRCDFAQPPRFEEDVIAAAEAFHQANLTGKYAPGMKGSLDLILTRRPRPYAEDDAPFEVYTGSGTLVPLAKYMAEHPRATYVAVDSRLRDLAVGPHGERAGDVLLIANNGNVERQEDRYYFAGLYYSWHGSPSRQDSEVPFIVAHPRRTTAELAELTRRTLGDTPTHADVAKLLLEVTVK